MDKPDQIRLQHMLDAAREARAFVLGRSRVELEANRMLVLALVKDIEIVGEAAAKISVKTRQLSPGVPWADIIGMRHRLIHAYFDVDLDILWETAATDLPEIIASIEAVLRSEGA